MACLVDAKIAFESEKRFRSISLRPSGHHRLIGGLPRAFALG
jgi:hypothetical protein